MGLQDYLDQNKASDGGSPLSTAFVPQGVGGISQMTLDKLSPFDGHTFSVLEHAPDFRALMIAVQEHGIQTPLLVRPSSTDIGRFEIISGHRRYRIAELLGLSTVPCTIHPCDNDTAIQLMAVSNVQRPDWLPSEKAKTYKAHLEATQRKNGITQGSRTDITSATRLPKLRTRDEASKIWGISGQMFDVYLRLNQLLPNLLAFTDEGRFVVKAAYELTFLSPDYQALIEKVFTRYPKKKLSAAKAKEIRELAKDDELNELMVLRVLGIAQKEKSQELSITANFLSSALTNKKTVKKLLGDADMLIAIEALLIKEAKKQGLPLE